MTIKHANNNNNSEYSLHSFRSLGDKKTLLEAASASMNGNAMMTVILFLKVRASLRLNDSRGLPVACSSVLHTTADDRDVQDTLSSNNFRALIAAHSGASNLYLRYDAPPSRVSC